MLPDSLPFQIVRIAAEAAGPPGTPVLARSSKKLPAFFGLRPAGGSDKIADAHGLTMLQLACTWNLQHAAVQSVVPTLIQEPGAAAKRIETKVEELASLPEITLTPDECAQIAEIGDNTNCMNLKGGSAEHAGDPLPDRWPLNAELEAVASRWHINPVHDLANAMHPAES